jgi:hypothetical protein
MKRKTGENIAGDLRKNFRERKKLLQKNISNGGRGDGVVKGKESIFLRG